MPKRRPTSHQPDRLPHLDAVEEYVSKLEQRFFAQTAQLKTITDSATSCLVLIDTQGRATYMNPSAVRATGYVLEDLLEKPLPRILHPDHPALAEGPCQVVPALEQLQSIRGQEDLFRRKDGTV